ncbi:molybdenum cofactor guanylyltransferase [Paenibacillus sp. YYML68]|uniref:molybdenum cofactor guanylyltransferase n=1 Tax=Paenibacillus sp. YYML68 TaxID=2909250 RepID=UPI0024916A37|nr:molybdenum cofactor guanylyltransferase [Paenibacillus sp. YYML68]
MLTGIILAGGDSERMNGTNKSLLTLDDEMLVQRQIRLMKQICEEIIIVTNEPRPYLQRLDGTIRIITDYVTGIGPLGGMFSGLSLAQKDHAWVIGCDMPFISAKAARLMLAHKQQHGYEVVFPCIQQVVHPLHAIYDRSCVKAIERMLHHHDYALTKLHRYLNWDVLLERTFVHHDIESSFLYEIKTQEDYLTAVELLELRCPGA